MQTATGMTDTVMLGEVRIPEHSWTRLPGHLEMVFSNSIRAIHVSITLYLLTFFHDPLQKTHLIGKKGNADADSLPELCTAVLLLKASLGGGGGGVGVVVAGALVAS